jgi:hypothetical protein
MAPGEVVDRLVYASHCRVQGSVFDEMHRIRDHALLRNMADEVCAALLYQSGWFVEWLEGPAVGIEAVMRRVARDLRHDTLCVIHRSRGPRRLTQSWSMAFRQDNEEPAEFQRRLEALSAAGGQQCSEPAMVWRRLSMPMKDPVDSQGRSDLDLYQRVMVCAARGTQSFELVHWLGQTHGRKVTRQRLAGAEDTVQDVANDYVDLEGGCVAVVRRVVAMARNGLQIGLYQAFLSDYSHMVLLLCGDARHDMDLIRMLVAACAGLSHRPVLLGLGQPGCDHAALREVARKGALVYLDCEVKDSHDARSIWAVAAPALDFSRTA